MEMTSLYQIPAAGKHRQLPVSLPNQPRLSPAGGLRRVGRRPPHRGAALGSWHVAAPERSQCPMMLGRVDMGSGDSLEATDSPGVFFLLSEDPRRPAGDPPATPRRTPDGPPTEHNLV